MAFLQAGRKRAPLPRTEESRTTVEFIITIFCQVDRHLQDVHQPPHATLSYRSVILQDKLGQSKATAHGIERNHCRQRHWCGHGKRQSIHLSKSYAMVELTVALFARF